MTTTVFHTGSNTGIVTVGNEAQLYFTTTNTTGSSITVSISYTLTTGDGVVTAGTVGGAVPANSSANFTLPYDGQGYGHRWVDFSASAAGYSQATTRKAMCYSSRLAGQATDTTGFAWGMNLGFNPTTQDWLAAQDIGVAHVRSSWEWSGWEYPPGSFHWTEVDAFISTAESYNMQVMWMFAFGRGVDPFGTPPSPTDYANAATQLATRYGTRIKYYELYNEPNNTNFWKGNANQYVAIMQAAASAIKSVNAALIVTSGGMAGLDGLPPSIVISGVDQQTLLNSNYFDIFMFHPHGDLTVQENDLADIASFRAASPTNPPIFANEVGQTSLTGQFARQARETVKKIISAKAVGMIGWTIYEMVDSGPDLNDSESNFGIMTYDRQPKPAIHAINEVVARLRSATYVGVPAGVPSGGRMHVFNAPGATITTCWAQSGSPSPMLLEVGAGAQAFDMWGNQITLTAGTPTQLYATFNTNPIYIYSPTATTSTPPTSGVTGSNVNGLNPYSRIRADGATIVSGKVTNFTDISPLRTSHTLAQPTSTKQLNASAITNTCGPKNRAIAAFTSSNRYVSTQAASTWGFLSQNHQSEVFIVRNGDSGSNSGTIISTTSGGVNPGMSIDDYYTIYNGTTTASEGAAGTSITGNPELTAWSIDYAHSSQASTVSTRWSWTSNDHIHDETSYNEYNDAFAISPSSSTPTTTLNLGIESGSFQFAEIIIFDRVLTPSERSVVYAYIQDYYGIEIQNSVMNVHGTSSLIAHGKPQCVIKANGVLGIVDGTSGNIGFDYSKQITQLNPFSRIRAKEIITSSGLIDEFLDLSPVNPSNTLTPYISSYYDKFTQSVPDLRINGREVVTFDLSRGYLYNGSLLYTNWNFLHEDGPKEVFLIGVRNANTEWPIGVFGTKYPGDAAPNQAGFNFIVGSTGYVTAEASNISNIKNALISPNPFIEYSPFVANFSADISLSPDMTLNLTGGQATQSANYVFTGENSDSNGMIFGFSDHSQFPGDLPINGTFGFAEYIIFDRTLSSAERDIVKRYVRSYYGIDWGLTPGEMHPRGQAVFAVVGASIAKASAPFTGTGILAIVGRSTANAANFTAGTATLAITGRSVFNGVLSSLGASGLVTVGTVITNASTSITGTGALTVVGASKADGAMAAIGSSSLTPVGSGLIYGSSSITASGGFTAAGTAATAGVSTLSGTGSLASVGFAFSYKSNLFGFSSTDIVGQSIFNGIASLQGTSFSVVFTTSRCQPTASGSLNVQGSWTADAQANLVGNSGILSIAGGTLYNGTCAGNGVGAVNANSNSVWNATTALSGNSSVNIFPSVYSAMIGSSSLSSVGFGGYYGTAVLRATGVLTNIPTVVVSISANSVFVADSRSKGAFSGVGTLSVAPYIKATMSARSTFFARQVSFGFQDNSYNLLQLPAIAEMLGWSEVIVADQQQLLDIYLFIIESIRIEDQVNGAFFLKRFLQGPQEVWNETQKKIFTLRDIWDIQNVPAEYLQFMKAIIGWTPEFDQITNSLSETSLRRLLINSIPIWKTRGSEDSLINALTFMSKTPSKIFDWFYYRWTIDEIGFDFSPADGEQSNEPWLIDELGERTYCLRIVDDGLIDRDLVVALAKLMRPTGERIEINYLLFMDYFNDSTTEYWKTYNYNTQTFNIGAFLISTLFSSAPGWMRNGTWRISFQPNFDSSSVSVFTKQAIVSFAGKVTYDSHGTAIYSTSGIRLEGSNALGFKIVVTGASGNVLTAPVAFSANQIASVDIDTSGSISLSGFNTGNNAFSVSPWYFGDDIGMTIGRYFTASTGISNFSGVVGSINRTGFPAEIDSTPITVSNGNYGQILSSDDTALAVAQIFESQGIISEYLASVKIRSDGGWRFGIAFYVEDQDNFYIVYADSDNRWHLDICVEGGMTELATAPNPEGREIFQGVWYQVRIQIVSTTSDLINTIAIYVDEKLIISTSDDSLFGGAIAIAKLNKGTAVSFAEVEIMSLPAVTNTLVNINS